MSQLKFKTVSKLVTGSLKPGPLLCFTTNGVVWNPVLQGNPLGIIRTSNCNTETTIDMPRL